MSLASPAPAATEKQNKNILSRARASSANIWRLVVHSHTGIAWQVKRVIPDRQIATGMPKRTVTAILMIPPVLYLIGWSPKWLFLLAVVLGAMLALHEYFGLCRAMSFKVFPWTGYAAVAVLCVAQTFPRRLSFSVITFLLAAFLLIIPTAAMRRSVNLKDYLVANAATLFGILYIGLSLSFLLPIRFDTRSFGGEALVGGLNWLPPLSAGSRLLLLLFVVIWAGDICAYLVGRPRTHPLFCAHLPPQNLGRRACRARRQPSRRLGLCPLVPAYGRPENRHSTCRLDCRGRADRGPRRIVHQTGGRPEGFRHNIAGPRRIPRPD